MKCMLQRVGFF
jgi:hypothetical protein